MGKACLILLELWVLVISVSFVAASEQFGGARVSSDGSTIYAYQYKNGGSIFKSVDSGKTFRWLENDVTSGWWGDAGIDANGTTILLGSTNAGGIIQSSDGGQTWLNVKSLPQYAGGPHMYSALAINDDATEMYAGVSNSGTLFRKKGSKDFEAVKIPGKIPRNTITCNSIDMSKDGESVYVVDSDTASELLVSSDHGDSWTSVKVTDDDELYPYSIAVAKEDPRIMITGFSDFELESGALFLSTDAGATFQDITALTQKMLVSAVAISGDGQYILAATANLWGDDSTPAEEQGHLFLSVDQGVTWAQIKVSEPTSKGFYDVSMSRDGKVMVAIGESREHTYMFISNDYGQTWVNANNRCKQI